MMQSWMLLVACAAISLLGKVGDAFSPVLLSSSRPFLLLLLNASDAHLALTSGLCTGSVATALGWLALVTFRRVAEDGCYYLLGRYHGADAARLLGVDLPKASERYRHASMLALFAFPTAPVCIAAGTSGTSRAAFFGADACATLLRAGVLLVLAFEPYTPSERLLEAVRSLAARHPATSLALTTTLATPGVLGALALLRRAWQASGSDAAASTPPLECPPPPSDRHRSIGGGGDEARRGADWTEAAAALVSASDYVDAPAPAAAPSAMPPASSPPPSPPPPSPPPSPPSTSPGSSRGSSPGPQRRGANHGASLPMSPTTTTSGDGLGLQPQLSAGGSAIGSTALDAIGSGSGSGASSGSSGSSGSSKGRRVSGEGEPLPSSGSGGSAGGSGVTKEGGSGGEEDDDEYDDEADSDDDDDDDSDDESGSTSTSPSLRRRRLRKSLKSGPAMVVGRPEMPPRPIETRRMLVPRGRWEPERRGASDKWRLISGAVGTTNALQHSFVAVRASSTETRVHPRGREPGNLGANWAPRTRNNDGEFAPDWLAGLRVDHASLYASWERCSRFCKEEELACHVAMCQAARKALRSNPMVTAELNAFWDVIEPDLPPPPPAKAPALHLEHYTDMQLRFHKALVRPPALSAGFNEADAIKMAEADWELDRNPEEVIGRKDTPVMRKKTFLDAVFNVADA